MSAHDVPQSVVPPPHVVLQAPLEQTSPAGHAVPQAPQLALSVFVSTHDPPHSVLVEPHETIVTSDPASLPDPSPLHPADSAVAKATAMATETVPANHPLRIDVPLMMTLQAQ